MTAKETFFYVYANTSGDLKKALDLSGIDPKKAKSYLDQIVASMNKKDISEDIKLTIKEKHLKITALSRYVGASWISDKEKIKSYSELIKLLGF